ncbi:MAG TPA: D-alanine--D-alanine ligase [Oscillospiraceae bacterium]|nr:D-alanine--D-alanine ligase [Oscillospiraceae bacterium]
MKIVVLAGGISTERDVSLSSGAMICRALRARGHKAALVDAFLGLPEVPEDLASLFSVSETPAARVAEAAPSLADVRALREDGGRRFFGPGVLEVCACADVVFIALHGCPGEDGRIQGAFDLLGIPYTGAGFLGSAMAMDKGYTKTLVRAAGILTPDWERARLEPEDVEEKTAALPLPCVVKTPTGGSSIGVYLCRDRAALRGALGRTAGEEVLVERLVEGRELTCGVLEDRALPTVEIVPNEGFYDYKNKYQPGATLEVCPARVPEEIEARARETALAVHRLLGLGVYSRSDFILAPDGKLYFLEINTLPGMTPTSLIPQEAAAVGIPYEELCDRIVTASLAARGIQRKAETA